MTFGNGLALAKAYDQNDRLTGTQVSATGATRPDLTFERNTNGQLAGVTDNAATGSSASFGYYDSGGSVSDLAQLEPPHLKPGSRHR